MWCPERGCWPLARQSACAWLVLGSAHVHAALGQPVSATQAEALAHKARVQQAGAGLAQVHVLRMADGSEVRQYSGPDGVVYLVSWSTRQKPRLDVWLGTYFPSYATAARRALAAQPGVRHGVVLEQGDLVVQSHGHAQAFVGRAWLKSKVDARALAQLQ